MPSAASQSEDWPRPCWAAAPRWRRRTTATRPEQAILGDAAKRLGVSAADLEDALAKAEDAQLDKAVKDGKLTKEQADELKKRREESGRVLGFPGGGPRFGHHELRRARPALRRSRPAGRRGEGARHQRAQALLRAARRQDARPGREGPGEVAGRRPCGSEGVDEEHIDEAVKDGKLTQKQADEILEHLDDRLEHLGEGGPFGGERHFGRPPGAPGAPRRLRRPRPSPALAVARPCSTSPTSRRSSAGAGAARS